MAEKPTDVRPRVVVELEQVVLDLEANQSAEKLEQVRDLCPKVMTEDVLTDGSVTVEQRDALVERATRLLGVTVEEAVTPGKPPRERKAATPRPTVRALGERLSVRCDCGGFKRSSSMGDWTSIRYQAKSHAHECQVANPHDTFVNDLDLVRDSLVKRRQDIRSGGLVFWVGDGEPHESVAASRVMVTEKDVEAVVKRYGLALGAAR